MDLNEAIVGRRSIRRFTKERVPLDQLVKLVEAGTWAPTAGNVQSWRFVIVDDSRVLRQLNAVSPGMLGIPTALIAICQDKDVAFKRGSVLGRDVGSVMDAAMAAQNIMLAAFASGLGTCAVLSFHKNAVRRFLDLPEHVQPELLITVGVPDISPVPPKRAEDGVIFVNSLKHGITESGA
jgi:nitroreductase